MKMFKLMRNSMDISDENKTGLKRFDGEIITIDNSELEEFKAMPKLII